ncbi:hypothetical protein [Neorhizobium sp. LjRoot104]|uniref:hypothetical protein n=1 Tax=Neorhizobium sp. LjRoot104 TaxID=3342254 RepID=UPI003ECF6B95
MSGFESKYGIEAFLDVMAGIMQDRLGDPGFNIESYDDERGDHDGKPEQNGGGDHRSVERYGQATAGAFAREGNWPGFVRRLR